MLHVNVALTISKAADIIMEPRLLVFLEVGSGVDVFQPQNSTTSSY